MAFGAVENEVIVDGVGMTLLVNYNRRLAKSKMDENLYIDIIKMTSVEIKNVAKAENFTKESAMQLARKAQVLLCATITMHETLKENELLWNIDDSLGDQITDSLMGVVQDCKID